MKDDSWPQTTIDSALSYTKLYFEFVKNNNNKTWKKLKTFSDEIHNYSWAEYVNLTEEKNEFD